VHLIGAFVAASVVSRFDQAIGEVVALAVLMPVIASMGGVAGGQSLALVVRAIALDQVGRGNRWRVLLRESVVGLGNGLLWASVVSAATLLWFRDLPLALVAGAAMIINLAVAGLAGTLIPIALQRAGLDPALGSGVLVIVATDVIGFLSFLGLASVFVV
jgi:magnesium transporter